MIYAGFWKRAVAFFIDGLVLSIPMIFIASLLLGTQVFSFMQTMGATAEPSPDMMFMAVGKYMLAVFAINILNIIVLWLYHALMESGKNQATLGKMALGIKVVGAEGERISFARASGRFFAKFLSHFPFYFGDYMAGFTQHRQALHDLIATTYVVNKNYQQGQELPALKFSTGGLIAGILAAISPIVLYVGMIIMAMFLAVSEVGNSSVKLENLRHNTQRDTKITFAQLELFMLSNDNKPLDTPLEKDNIVYSKTPQGYTASFKDEQGNEYELLQRTDEFTVCCLKGPNGKCTDNASLPIQSCN